MNATAPNAGWNIGLWVLQILLAVAFALAGFMKTTAPIEDLIAQMQWPGLVPEALVRFIGVSEFVGAVGLVVPAATRIAPRLTPLAAACLALIMVLALVMHAARGEGAGVAVNVVLGGLAVLVAWGRTARAPISSR